VRRPFEQGSAGAIVKTVMLSQVVHMTLRRGFET
jgi:hypothetical protein